MRSKRWDIVGKLLWRSPRFFSGKLGWKYTNFLVYRTNKFISLDSFLRGYDSQKRAKLQRIKTRRKIFFSPYLKKSNIKPKVTRKFFIPRTLHSHPFRKIYQFLSESQSFKLNKVYKKKLPRNTHEFLSEFQSFKLNKVYKKKPRRYFYKTNEDVFWAPWWVQKKIRRKVFLSKDLLKSLISHNKKKATLITKTLFYKRMFYHPFFWKFLPAFNRFGVPYKQVVNKKIQKIWKEKLHLINKPRHRRFTSTRHWFTLNMPKVFFIWIKQILNNLSKPTRNTYFLLQPKIFKLKWRACLKKMRRRKAYVLKRYIFLRHKMHRLLRQNTAYANRMLAGESAETNFEAKPNQQQSFILRIENLLLDSKKLDFINKFGRLINMRRKFAIERTSQKFYRFGRKKRSRFVLNVRFKTYIKTKRRKNFRKTSKKRFLPRANFKNKASYLLWKLNRLKFWNRSKLQQHRVKKNKRKLKFFVVKPAHKNKLHFFQKAKFLPVQFNKNFCWPPLQVFVVQRIFYTKEYKIFTKFCEDLYRKPSFNKKVRLTLNFPVKCALSLAATLQVAFSQLNWFKGANKFKKIMATLINPKNTLPKKFFKHFFKKSPRIFSGYKKYWNYWSTQKKIFSKLLPLKYKCGRRRYQFRATRDISVKKFRKIESLAKRISDFYNKKYQAKQARNKRYESKPYNKKKDFYRHKNKRKKNRKYYYKNRPYPIINRWSFLSKRFVWPRLQKNKSLPIYPKNYFPFIKNFILTNKNLSNSAPLSESNAVLGKVHWMTAINEFSYEADLLPLKFELKAHDLDIDLIYHNQQQISYLLYSNWPRKIVHHFTRHKHMHKRQVGVLTDWLMDIIGFPPQRFDKFHKLFSLNFRLTRLAPWLQALFFRRTLSPLQYFKIWSPVKVIYHKKRNRIYNKFTKQQYNSYSQIKFLPSRRGGGNRNFETNRILSKVVLPFFYTTFSGMSNLFNSVRSKKAKHFGRFTAFTKLFDSQIFRLIYRLNITPNVVWAKDVVEAGWVYVSFRNNMNNKKPLLNKLSFEKLFPFLKINNKYKVRTEKSHQFLNIPVTRPENKIDNQTVLNINQHFRLIIRQFFTRRLKWNRRVWPSFADNTRQKNTFVIMQKNYNDKFAKFTKDRSNIKKLPFLHN